MDFKKLKRRKAILLRLRKFARDLPESEPTRGKAIEWADAAIMHEKRGEHDRADALVRELSALVQHRLKVMP